MNIEEALAEVETKAAEFYKRGEDSPMDVDHARRLKLTAQGMRKAVEIIRRAMEV